MTYYFQNESECFIGVSKHRETNESVVDEKKSVDNAVPKSTGYKTKWSCKVFEEWKQNRLVKSCSLEPGGFFTTKDFEEGVQTLDTAITEISVINIH